MKQAIDKIIDLLKEKFNPLMEIANANLTDIPAHPQISECVESETLIKASLKSKNVQTQIQDFIECNGEVIRIGGVDTETSAINEHSKPQINEISPRPKIASHSEKLIKINEKKRILIIPRNLHESISYDKNRRLSHIRLYNDVEPCDAIERYFQ